MVDNYVIKTLSLLVFNTSFQGCLRLFTKGVKHSCLKVFNTVEQGCLTPLKLIVLCPISITLRRFLRGRLLEGDTCKRTNREDY